MNQYVTGNTVRVSADFTTVSTGAPVDPATVSVTTRDPFGSENTYTGVRDSTGDYHYDVAAVTVGVWGYRWVGIGANEAAAEQFFEILPSVF